MSSPRLRRRVRVFTGRGLRLLRTHFFSFVSAGIIGGVFLYAMTSSSFSVDNPPAVHSAAVVATAFPTAVPSIYARPASIVYYIVRSDVQRQAILAAMRSDQAYRARANAYGNPDEVGFFISDTAEEDVALAGLVDNMLETARQNGIGLRIIDIRDDWPAP